MGRGGGGSGGEPEIGRKADWVGDPSSLTFYQPEDIGQIAYLL